MIVPPRIVRAQAVLAGVKPPDGEGPEAGPLSPARRHGESPARGRPALPVLEAFHEFLDMERQRARRRLFLTALFFSVIFIVFCIAAVTGGWLLYSNVAGDLQDVRNEVASARGKTLALDRQTQSSLGRLASDAAAWRDEVLKKTQQFLLGQSGLSEQVEETVVEIRELREALDALKRENDAMRNSLAALRRPASLGENIAASPAPPVFLPVFIRPEGSDRNVAWRLPIP
jgi:hypothetical protein